MIIDNEQPSPAHIKQVVLLMPSVSVLYYELGPILSFTLTVTLSYYCVQLALAHICFSLLKYQQSNQKILFSLTVDLNISNKMTNDSQKEMYCMKCSLQFGSMVVFDMHISLVHKQNEEMEDNLQCKSDQNEKNHSSQGYEY